MCTNVSMASSVNRGVQNNLLTSLNPINVRIEVITNGVVGHRGVHSDAIETKGEREQCHIGLLHFMARVGITVREINVFRVE